MSEIKHGRYKIHFHPPGGGLGGSYATYQELNKPVRLYAMVPKFMGQQEWLVTHGDDGNLRIFSTVNGSVLSTTDPTAVPSGPVIAFKPEWPAGAGIGPVIIEQNWTITPVESATEPDLYTIRPVTKAVGRDYCLGTHGNEMHIQSFDIRHSTPRPQWQLVHCGDFPEPEE